jgi:hypothetical protein
MYATATALDTALVADAEGGARVSSVSLKFCWSGLASISFILVNSRKRFLISGLLKKASALHN